MSHRIKFEDLKQPGGPEGPLHWQLFLQCIPGAELKIRTTDTRATVSFVMGGYAHDACWVRKELLPDDIVRNLHMHYAVRGRKSIYICRIGEERPEHLRALRARIINKFETQPESQSIAKETTVSLTNTFSAVLNDNKTAAKQAAYNEAGRIANSQARKLLAKKAPLAIRGYLDTPLGQVLVANLVAVAAQHLRPQDATLRKLTTAMTTMAYHELINTFDFEGMLEDFLGGDVAKALAKVDD